LEWVILKRELSQLALSKDALHIYAAIAVQIAAAGLCRTWLGSLLPWLAVLVLELVNEGLDLSLKPEESIRAWQIAGSIQDIANTMVVPTILLLLVRYVPGLFCSPAPASPPDEAFRGEA
jgi:hypothetical protein